MIKLGIWHIIGGAALLLIIGFNIGGLLSEGKAQDNSGNLAREAVTNRLAEICVAQYNMDPEKAQKLRKMEKMNVWEKTEYIENQGWSIMPSETESDSQVAKKCSSLLTDRI